MIRPLKLLLPALIPSWRFFDIIAPSPRIEVAMINIATQDKREWQEFRPRPSQLSFGTMVKRLFWNPDWNESLFLVSCAERLSEKPTDHSYQEILNHIRTDSDYTVAPYIQFRLVFISRDGNTLQKEVRYISKVHALDESHDT